MPAGYDLFNNVRINSVMQGILDPRLLPQQFLFSKRIPTVRATDAEITARFIQYPQVADLVADDQRAVVYNTGKFQLQTTKVPNLKIGYNMNQSMLAQVLQIAANPGAVTDQFFTDWENNALYTLKLGIAQRIEILLAAMLTDSFVYDRMGLKVAASWGMPSPLKVTPTIAWDHTPDSGVTYDATPVTDVLTLRRLARVAYGVNLNRLTMSLAAFNYMVKTTEFMNRAKTFIPIGFTLTGQFATENTGSMLTLASKIFDGIEIVLYDAMYWSQDATGTPSMFPYLPITKVIFDNSEFDGNRTVWDLANTQVIEAMVASLGGSPISGAGQNAVGPISYATFPPNLNPPDITYWAVQRCFPRKHMLQANAVLTVGAFADPISATVPF